MTPSNHPNDSNDETMVTKPRNIRIPDPMWETIESEVEDSIEYDNRSDFVRTAIDHELDGIHNEDVIDRIVEEVATEATATVDDQALADMEDSLNRLASRLLKLESRVTDADRIEELAHQLYQQLPSDNEIHEETPGRCAPADPTLEEAQQWSTAEVWASYLDEETQRVRLALARTREYHIDVRRMGSPPNQRYYLKTRVHDADAGISTSDGSADLPDGVPWEN